MDTPRPVALLVTHGLLGRELVSTVEAILGTQTDVVTVSNNGLSADGLVQRLVDEIGHLPADAPVVLFSDLAAGSCGIASRRAELGGRELKRIAGINLPSDHQAATTVVMVTHERALAERYAHRIVTLADGQVASEEYVGKEVAS